MSRDYLERILTARVYEVAIESPLDPAPRLSERCGNTILLKREDLQPVFSFKLRGAYNKMALMSEADRQRGVICASAGNHAQGVALAAQKLGCEATIFMPRTTPEIKIEAVKKLGGTVELVGDSYDEAHDAARLQADQDGRVFVHPYDDPDVIAGQGTIAMELLRQCNDAIDAIFVPVGGGGLIAGIAVYIKRLRPEIKIIGVEPDDAASMHASLAAGERVTLSEVGLFADGVAVKKVGEETFRLCREYVDEIELVRTDAICAAIKDVFEDTRSILEPAGALSVAGAKAYLARNGLKDQRVICIAGGANMNFDRLRHVSERAEFGEGREAILAVTIPERPGSFKNFCSLLGPLNVTEFNYRYADPEQAHIFVGVGTDRGGDPTELLTALQAEGFPAINLTDNEMAKLHLRHMVGGRVPGLEDERLYRFEFPERPGALMRFLDQMPRTWMITLFHYRNHGTDVGRVLCGLQIPEADRKSFEAFLEALGYHYIDESDNPAYHLFC